MRKAILFFGIVLFLFFFQSCATLSDNEGEDIVINSENLYLNLIDDSFKILNENSLNNIKIDDEFIKKAIEKAEENSLGNYILNYSINPLDMGLQVSLVIDKIYKETTGEVNIPRVIHYDGYNQNIDKQLKDINDKISMSVNINRDKYNLALNLLVNMWIKDIESKGIKYDKPKSGLYLRDDDGDLYFYE